MVSINTNLQSLIVQNSLLKSTNALNQAIERMTTGFKINHASDNAAGYSIAQNMTSKLSSYDVAADNISSGLDLLKTAQDTISLMQTKGERLMALWTQAQNGTYGTQSLSAINAEATAIIQEINRLYSNTEYNGMNILEGGIQLPDWAQELTDNVSNKYNGFIADPKTYTDDQVSVMNSLSGVSESTTISSGTYKISSKDELKQLATMVNNGKVTGGTFVLANDIDLENEEWTAIGADYSHQFKGTFDGNGHTISNLKIDKPTQDNQGLFGSTADGSTIKNVGLKDVDIKGGYSTGGLVGEATGSITNSYATGSVTGRGDTGGLVGHAGGSVSNSYATGNVTGQDYTGGLVGYASGSVTNSYATGSVTGQDRTGGLVGFAQGSVTNSYSTGNVTGDRCVGGLVGIMVYPPTSDNHSVTNNFSSANVSGEDCVGNFIGGLGICPFSSGNFEISNNLCSNLNDSNIGGCIDFDSFNDIDEYDNFQDYLDGIENMSSVSSNRVLQVGIHGDSSSQISVDTGISLNINISDISSAGAYDTIKSFLDQLSAKATELGAASNRLESALESTMVSMENITSSLSTIRDADIAKESSSYIKAQILQQASATLLATANQTPSIALQLL